MTGARSRPCGTRARAGPAHKVRQDGRMLFCRLKGGLRESVWVVASPPRWRGPQARALWHHGGHGAVDVVGPMAPPGRASGRGYAGVYTDRRKWPLGATRPTRRMRFSVTSPAQNALFRRVRFSSPAQTWSHLTQRRILRRRSHVKAHSAPAVSRKGALRATARMQSAPFGEAHTQNAPFRDVARPECAFRSRRDRIARPECAFP